MTDDLISRHEVLNKLYKLDQQDLYLPCHFKEFVIDEVPSVPQKTGHWIGRFPHLLSSVRSNVWTCSECDNLVETAHYAYRCYYKYCPNCGARMEENVE